jgi:subtilisin family serine protease
VAGERPIGVNRFNGLTSFLAFCVYICPMHLSRFSVPMAARAYRLVAQLFARVTCGMSGPVQAMLCAGVALSAQAAMPNTSTNYVQGEVLVTFNSSLDWSAAKSAMAGHSLQIAKHYAFLSERTGRQLALVRATNMTTAALLAELGPDPAVAVVEPNYIRWAAASAAPNDPLFGRLWGLQNTGQTLRTVTGTPGRDIRFLKAWGLARPSTNSVVVAVVDTGVDYTHPDLAANIWVNPGEIPGNGMDDDGNGYVDDYHGYDFADDTGDPIDSGEHGTHVSGTIAAIGNNGIGVIGVDSHAKIMALRVSNDGESFVSSAVIEAIQYAAMMKSRGVNVVAINGSYGSSDFSSAEESAIQVAGQEGIVFCAAAGNNNADNDSTPEYPADYRLPNMIVVAATDQNDALADFSDYGTNTVDLGAPGVNILSTTPPGITSYVQVASATLPAEAMEYAGTTTGTTASIYDCGLGYRTNFPTAVRGNIALIRRGTLYFSEKAANAMAAGAVGAVIFNNTNVPFTGTLEYPSNWIPVVSLSESDGLALQALLPATGTIFSAKDSSVIYQYLDGTSMATPHVSGAVAFAAMNLPNETATQRVQRILASVDPVAALQGKVATGGRLDLLRVVDRDGNGLPDWWEQLYFGHTGVDPNADPDGDGMSNWQEYVADTDPRNPGSSLRLTGVQFAPEGLRLSWSGGTEARQYLERSSSPGNPNSWVDLLTNQPPTAASASFIDSTATNNNTYFYRLRVDRP